MKKILFLVALLLLLPVQFVWAQIHITTADEITISGRTLDSSGFYATPDSVRIVVYRDGVEMSDAWFNSGDGECAAINDMLVFTDAFADIDGTGGDGLYEVMAGFFEGDGDLYYWKSVWFYIGVDMSELTAVNDSIEAWDDNIAEILDILDTLQTYDDANGLIADVQAILDTIQLYDNANNFIADIQAILDTLQLWDTRIDSMEAALADANIATKVWTLPATRTITGDVYTPDVNVASIENNVITAASINADAITEAKIADNAIAAEHLADDAIDYATFAASAPTAWWNEGKTGYTLTAAQWEEVWRNIDTANIDTSEIGEWLSTGISGGSLTKEAVADCVLDSMEAGTARDIKMKSLVISNSGGDAVQFTSTGNNGDGLQVTGNGDGIGMSITGGSTGSGLTAISGASGSSDYGIFAGAYGAGSIGFYAYGYTGAASQGMKVLSDGSGNDFTLGAASLESEIADAVWNEDTTGHYTAPHMGYMASQTGASGSDTVAIKAMYGNNPGLVIIEDTLTDGEEVAIMPGDWTPADSNAYQGSASGLDSNKVSQVFNSFGWGPDSSLYLTYLQIKDSADSAIFLVTNWGGGDAIQINAQGSGNGIDVTAISGNDIEGNITGTIDSVNYLKSGVSCCSGSGAKSYTIYVADSSGGDTTFLSGVVVSAYSMSGDLQAGMKTDSYGKVTYATDLDSIFLIATKFNYYSNPDTIIVSETGYTDTTFVYRGIIPTSGSPDLCRLYGFIYDISGNPDGSAAVTAWLPAGVSRLDSSIISPYRVETTTDSTGYFYIDLIPNANLIPDTTKYEITIVRTDGTILRERVTVPDEESWLLTW